MVTGPAGPPRWLRRVRVLGMLQSGIACLTACWLVALALGVSEVTGWLLFLLCLVLLAPCVVLGRRAGPPPVPPMMLSGTARTGIYAVVGVGFGLMLVGEFTDHGRVLQAGIAVVLGLVGVLSTVAARRVVRLWKSGRVLPGQDDLPQDQL